MSPADRFLAAHGVRLDSHDLTLEQAEAIAAIADGAVSLPAVPGRPAKAVA